MYASALLEHGFSWKAALRLSGTLSQSREALCSVAIAGLSANASGWNGLSSIIFIVWARNPTVDISLLLPRLETGTGLLYVLVAPVTAHHEIRSS
jgi:hypothetical protein